MWPLPLTSWPQGWSFHALAPWTTYDNLHQNRFICFQNIMFITLKYRNKRTDNLRTYYILYPRLSVWAAGDTNSTVKQLTYTALYKSFTYLLTYLKTPDSAPAALYIWSTVQCVHKKRQLLFSIASAKCRQTLWFLAWRFKRQLRVWLWLIISSTSPA